jgi:hypothetical protein
MQYDFGPGSRDEILGHKFNKRLESFAQFLLLADFKENHIHFNEQHFVEQKNEGSKPEKTRV